jgi:glucose-6-phosphate 1-epimerase
MTHSHQSLGIALPPSVRLIEDGALPRLDVASRAATARVYLHGAHITDWRPAHADAPVLWTSSRSLYQPDKAIRGGVPVCFPWFGPHAADKSAPGHGFGRITTWTLTEADEASDGTVTLTLTLEGDNLSELGPHVFLATHRITIGPRLTMALEVENRDEIAFTFEEALHTYFRVSNAEQVTIAGLEGADYLDKVASFARRSQGTDAIRFRGETDRVYVGTGSTCVIHDPGMRRRITIEKSGSQSTVVWNPGVERARALTDIGEGEWRDMVCVETANVGDAAVRLDPCGSHTMTATISVAQA